MTLFERKSFVMHSGEKSDYKIECDALTEEDIETLALLISKKYKFCDVYGVPSGGIRIEQALEKYMTNDSEHPLLIVDDVLTTGASMEEVRESVLNRNVIGVVIFARGKCPDWITPVLQMW